jgi:hypothetical protein
VYGVKYATAASWYLQLQCYGRPTGCASRLLLSKDHLSLRHNIKLGQLESITTNTFSTTLASLSPQSSSSYLMRRSRSGSPAGDIQPIAYQAPALDSDSYARQAFLSMCAAGFPTTCSVSGNPSNGMPFFSAYPCYLSKSVQAVPKVSCVISRLSHRYWMCVLKV